MKVKNCEYKKITIDLPVSVYNDLKLYCHSRIGGRLFYKDVVKNAIIGYLRNDY